MRMKVPIIRGRYREISEKMHINRGEWGWADNKCSKMLVIIWHEFYPLKLKYGRFAKHM